MRSSWQITLVATIVLIGTPALAEDGPFMNRRPGLWLTTIGGPRPTVLRECTDAAHDAANWAARTARLPPGCTPPETRRTQGGGASRMVCTTAAGTTTTDIEMERTDGMASAETETYRVITHVAIEPRPAQLPDGVTVVLNSRWTGPCPADMQPGETVDAAGRPLPRPAQ